MRVDPNSLIGKTEKEAAEKVVNAGMRCRVTEREGKALIGTCDLRGDRINIRVANGKVTSANIG